LLSDQEGSVSLFKEEFLYAPLTDVMEGKVSKQDLRDTLVRISKKVHSDIGSMKKFVEAGQRYRTI
jgi:hypothetical protein